MYIERIDKDTGKIWSRAKINQFYISPTEGPSTSKKYFNILVSTDNELIDFSNGVIGERFFTKTGEEDDTVKWMTTCWPRSEIIRILEENLSPIREFELEPDPNNKTDKSVIFEREIEPMVA